MLVNISNNLLKDGETEHIYHGVTRNGQPDTTINPILEGNIIAGAFYQSDIDILSGGSMPDDSEEHPGMKVIRASYFGPLYITYSEDDEYMEFVDSIVESVLALAYGDGTGLKYTQAQELESISTTLAGNTNIQSFDEFVNFSSIIDIAGAFNGCNNLSSIVLPQHITSVGQNAFKNCSSITGITIPSLVTSIGSSSFSGCSGLTSIAFPSSLASIGSYAFSSCTGLAGTITIPQSVTSIGEHAFDSCSSITNITVPSSVSDININAFAKCGDGEGELIINGNSFLDMLAVSMNLKFLKVSISGNFTNRQIIAINSSKYIEEFRVGGNISCQPAQGNAGYVLYGGSNERNCKLKFFEVMGTCDGTIFYGNDFTLSPSGAILHLGYDTVTNSGFPCTPGQACASFSYLTNIYVGPGDSSDDAILQMYLNDDSWGQYASKLATWSSYNGKYKNS